MIKYLTDIVRLKAIELGSEVDQWKKLDLQTPVWLAPIHSGKTNRAAFRAVVGWDFFRFNNVLGLGFLLVVFGLQAYVAWLCWNVSTIKYFENRWIQIMNIFLFASSLFTTLLWLKPVKITEESQGDPYFSFKRRELIKFCASSVFFLLLVPALGRTVPTMQGNKLLYRRYRKNKRNKYKIAIADGFYVYKSRSKNVVYYFHNGISPSMKNISQNEMISISKRLRKIDVSLILKNKKYSIPYRDFVLEFEAYLHAQKNDFITSIKILFALINESANKYRPALNLLVLKEFDSGISAEKARIQPRVSRFICGLIFRAEKKVDESQMQTIWSLVNSEVKTIPADLFSISKINYYRDKRGEVRTWQLAKKLPWYMPKKLPWN